jgi:beta-1,4-mannosyl-glycoprotein beta-1,4-N-acetylglucosaminyltransferase
MCIKNAPLCLVPAARFCLFARYSVMSRLCGGEKYMSPPKIIDGFTFFNELDLLEIRLAELSGVVDQFILVEATKTFSGLAKPLHYSANKQRFARWADKINHIVVDFPDFPDEPASAWRREYLQRDAIAQGFAGFGKADIALISDVDEIPKAEILERSLQAFDMARTLVCLEAHAYNYTLDLFVPTVRWNVGPRAAAIGNIKTPNVMRRHRIPWSKKLAKLGLENATQRFVSLGAFKRSMSIEVVANAAWHFSYLGSHDAYELKIKSFSHQELNKPGITGAEFYDQKRRSRLSVNPSREEKLELADPSSLPTYVVNNLEKFAHLLSAETLAALRT